jgi:circadian clock protein KaiC
LEHLNIHDLTVSGDTLKDDSRYTVFHPAEVELDETTRAVLEEVERVNPERVVFDSLSEMRMLASDPLRFRRQILALKQYFIGRKCTVLLLDDRTRKPRSVSLKASRTALSTSNTFQLNTENSDIICASSKCAD